MRGLRPAGLAGDSKLDTIQKLIHFGVGCMNLIIGGGYELGSNWRHCRGNWGAGGVSVTDLCRHSNTPEHTADRPHLRSHQARGFRTLCRVWKSHSRVVGFAPESCAAFPERPGKFHRAGSIGELQVLDVAAEHFLGNTKARMFVIFRWITIRSASKVRSILSIPFLLILTRANGWK